MGPGARRLGAEQLDSAVRDAGESAAERRSAIRDAVKKAGEDLERTVDDARDNIRNAFDRDRDEDTTDSDTADESGTDASDNDASDNDASGSSNE